jgi:hypothetical protein
MTEEHSRRRSGWSEAAALPSISTSGTADSGDNQSSQPAPEDNDHPPLQPTPPHRIPAHRTPARWSSSLPRHSSSHIFQAHTDIAVYVCWFAACSLRDYARSPSTASFDVLRCGSIRRLSEHMTGAIHDDGDEGSLRYLLRSLGDIAMFNDRRSAKGHPLETRHSICAGCKPAAPMPFLVGTTSGSARCGTPSPLPVCTNRLSHFIPVADRVYGKYPTETMGSAGAVVGRFGKRSMAREASGSCDSRSV